MASSAYNRLNGRKHTNNSSQKPESNSHNTSHSPQSIYTTVRLLKFQIEEGRKNETNHGAPHTTDQSYNDTEVWNKKSDK